MLLDWKIIHLLLTTRKQKRHLKTFTPMFNLSRENKQGWWIKKKKSLKLPNQKRENGPSLKGKFSKNIKICWLFFKMRFPGIVGKDKNREKGINGDDKYVMLYADNSEFISYTCEDITLDVQPYSLDEILISYPADWIQSFDLTLPLSRTTKVSFRELDHISQRILKYLLMSFIWPLIKLIFLARNKNSNNKLPIFFRQIIRPTINLKSNIFAPQLPFNLNFRHIRIVQLSIFIIFSFD